MTRKPQRPRADLHHWKEGTIYLRGKTRVPLYWTPDPQHSPVLRMLQGEESVMYVPEIKFGHWMIVRFDHQLGWVDLRYVQVVEKIELFDEPEPVEPTSFLERSDHGDDREHETEAARPPWVDTTLKQAWERGQMKKTTSELTTAPPELEKIEKKAAEATDDSITLSRSDVKRLIGYIRGIKDILSSAIGRTDENNR
jgi:hypothetical protein